MTCLRIYLEIACNAERCTAIITPKRIRCGGLETLQASGLIAGIVIARRAVFTPIAMDGDLCTWRADLANSTDACMAQRALLDSSQAG